jgi:predicted GNAT family acetyltransferase
MTTEITRNTAENRYELALDGECVGVVEYRDSDGVREIFRTAVAPPMRGRGLAGELIAGAIADIRAENLLLLPTCAYALNYVSKHPEDLELVPPETAQRLGLA